MNILEYFYFVLIPLLSTETLGTIEPHHDKFSKHEHFTAEEGHNVAYDHDAFLGPDAEEFDKLSPEESKRRLKIIVEAKIDANKDSLVSLEELEAWIEIQRKAFMYEAVNEYIAKQDKDKDGKVSWKEYEIANFGEWDNVEPPKDLVRIFH